MFFQLSMFEWLSACNRCSKAGTKVAVDELCKRATAAKALQARK